ncbi:hypothetical protein QTG54_011574 [Skeletonema marinoi]|uniref:Uncharacterized protein n=1 Tax=Skeletonema marinoi TaxID=267567 RepID=A0AAD9D8C9_9STRA|nr:hypothetical protein QTG54_011574 [Skeletonema marinoi]
MTTAKNIDNRNCFAAEEGVEVVARNEDGFIENHRMLFDPDLEMPATSDFLTADDDESAAADLSIGLNDDDDAVSTNDIDRRNGGTMNRWCVGATTTAFLLLATVALFLIQQPADSTSAAAVAAKRVVDNLALAECCVNTATGTCHTTVKCNKKEKECIKCDKKAADGTYIWMMLGEPPAPGPEEPEPVNGGGTTEEACCLIIAENTCHVKDKCNKDDKNCQNSKCQKSGEARWQVPSKQSPAPTPAPTTPAPTSKQSPAPTPSPTTPAPTNPMPATPAPTGTPTAFTPAPTPAPTGNGNDDSTVYEYTNTGKTCSIGGGNNIQGPAPLADKRNVVVDFWTFGDSPYDFMVDTCLDNNGKASTCKECAVKNSDMKKLPYPNTCTFEGDDFKCLKESIIPFMNRKMDEGDGAFQVHLGDILKGTNSAANSRRCTEASFDSRAKLFEPAKNFLLINGDNESNECLGYDIKKPSDPIRSMWRSKFGTYSFTSDFPEITGGGRPPLTRVAGNEEIFGFEYKSIAFFGLDYPAGDTYITKNAPQDLNQKFVNETLASDRSCELKSIVLFSHVAPRSPVDDSRSPVDDSLNDYFNRCGVLPTLAVLGNAHPSTYCLTKKDERFSLTVEAFQSGPLMVSVVRDLKEGGGDYFHVADSDLKNSNSDCPKFA